MTLLTSPCDCGLACELIGAEIAGGCRGIDGGGARGCCGTLGSIGV